MWIDRSLARPALLAATLAAACSSGPSGHGGPDGGSAGSGDDGGSGSTTGAVTGRVYDACRRQTGDVQLPTDLSTWVVQAFVPDLGPGGYRVVRGTGMADGTFRIDGGSGGVPDGVTYLLQLQIGMFASYYATDQHTLDLPSQHPGRCLPDPELATRSTPVTFSLAGITPYSTVPDQVDRLDVRSFSADYHARLSSGDVAVGDATNPTIATFDWSRGGFPVLVDAAQGDDLHVFHVRADSQGDPATRGTTTMTHLIDQFETTGVTVRDGLPVEFDGAFSPLGANRNAAFSIDGAALAAGYTAATSFTEMQVNVLARPPLPFTQGVTLAGFAFTGPAPSFAATGVPYADPFPESWQRYVQIDYSRQRSFKVPGSTFASGSSAETFQEFVLDGAIAPPPPLSPANGIRIGGADFDAGGQVVYDGRESVDVRWDPVPGATSYELTVQRLGATSIDDFLFITLRTAGTELQLPTAVFAGDLLVSGSAYGFTLSALQWPDDYRTGHFGLTSLVQQQATAASGRFRLLAHCGDGVVQPLEEECDTAGESKTCNIDCTKAACGDGLRNAAAGEECDTAGSSDSCNANCTLRRN